jgi:hypothetical protein
MELINIKIVLKTTIKVGIDQRKMKKIRTPTQKKLNLEILKKLNN